MKILSKILTTFIIFSLFLLPQLSLAKAGLPSAFEGDFIITFNRITGIVRPITIISFTGMFLYAGYLWITAGSDSKQVSQSQHTLITSVVGLIIILVLPSAVSLICGIFGIAQCVDFVAQIS